jgi:hypothetical protein
VFGAFLRLLYLPNEVYEGNQSGVRTALGRLAQGGALDAFLTVALEAEAARTSAGTAMRYMLEQAAEFQPQGVLWQHISSFPVVGRILNDVLSLKSRPVLGYHEGDAWGRWYKPITSSMQLVTRHADVVFLSGLGSLSREFRRAGARRIMWSPSAGDTDRFELDVPADVTHNREFDIVMIGNRATSRIPMHRMPGAATRERLVSRLTSEFGDRFRVYGEGWDKYASAGGPVPYNEQGRVNQRAWISVSWDHFPRIPYYFSDRLPTSLLSSVPHVTNSQPGYQHLFPEGCGVYHTPTIDDMVDCLRWLLCQPPSWLVSLGKQAQSFAREASLTQNAQTAVMVEELLRIHRLRTPGG